MYVFDGQRTHAMCFAVYHDLSLKLEIIPVTNKHIIYICKCIYINIYRYVDTNVCSLQNKF